MGSDEDYPHLLDTNPINVAIQPSSLGIKVVFLGQFFYKFSQKSKAFLQKSIIV